MKSNVYTEIVSDAIRYIEDNIYEKLSLDAFSKYIRLSKHHLHRLFKSLTGKKLMNYVTSRKLSLSLNELLETDMRVVDIANQYGFDYEISYIRAFTREFGLSPGSFRKKRCGVEITDVINLEHITPISLDMVVFKPMIIILPGFHLIGIRHFVNHLENNESFQLTELARDFFYNQSGRITNAKSSDVYFGFIEHIKDDPVYKYYLPSLEVTGHGEVPDGMSYRMVPTRKYAVFKYAGLHHPDKTTIRDLAGIYEYIGEWMKSSGYSFCMDYHFERIDTSICEDNYCEVEIYMPVIDKLCL